MVDNFIPYFDMQEQLDTLPKKNVEGQLETICAEIAARKTVDVKITAVTRTQMKLYHNRLAKRFLRKDTALEYTVNNDCVLCGTCAKVCPANNITVTDRVRFSDHCEVCYACLHNCPQNAIHMPVEANGAVRFRNEHVTLTDIIHANG